MKRRTQVVGSLFLKLYTHFLIVAAYAVEAINKLLKVILEDTKNSPEVR